MLVGYSLSPGGLLFPWHIGTLACLSYNEALTDANPIAGSSAGAIAVASHGAGISPEKALEATVRISDDCRALYGNGNGSGSGSAPAPARGNLLPLLKRELNDLLDEDVHHVLNEREGFVGLAYKELFPINRPVLDTYFEDKDHVIDSVCNSSMFPFFSTNWPCRIARPSPSPRLRNTNTNMNANTNTNTNINTNGGGNDWNNLLRARVRVPRIAVDGYFSVDRSRFGCPDLDTMDHARAVQVPTRTEDDERDVDEESSSASPANDATTGGSVPLGAKKVERTVTISVFPHDVVGMTASDDHDQISPEILNPENPKDQLSNLFRLATQCATREEYYQLYEDGWKDAERWLKEEEQRGGSYWSAATSTAERRSMYAKMVMKKNSNELN